MLAGLLFNPAQNLVQAQNAGSPPASTPIEHLVVLMQENHSFDNYFGTYPGADGIPTGTKMPVDPQNPGAGYVEPWHIGNSSITDLSHSVATYREQYNNGKMDGFVSALNRRNQDGRLAMGYYNGEDIPYYWNLADRYVLFDRFFSSASDGSFSNHMYWIAGVPPSTERGQSLAQRLNKTDTIFDRLEAAGISWKFYIQNYDSTITYRNLGTSGNRASQVIWAPVLNIDRFIDDPKLSSHIVDLSQYYEDLRSGTLPAVAYIVPSGASEHPPSNIQTGQRFVKTLVQELMRSSAWNSSAFLLLYDDWGGWYDHVKPVAVDAYGYGPRVPGLLVSPYARVGHIDSTQLDFTSVLKFIEENWNLKPLAERDAKANNFLSAFDFNQDPRKPEYLAMTRMASAASPAVASSAVKRSPDTVIFTGYGLALTTMIGAVVFARLRKNTRPRKDTRLRKDTRPQEGGRQ
jgi:phospholipase C